MYKVGDDISGYKITQEDIDFLNSEDRQNRINKSNLLGLLDNIEFNDDYSMIEYIKPVNSIVLPDIAIGLGGGGPIMSTISKIKLNEHIKVITNHTLSMCDIRNIELNEGLEVIGEKAMCLNRLKNITIPSSVKKMGEEWLDDAFQDSGTIQLISEQVDLVSMVESLGIRTTRKDIKLIISKVYREQIVNIRDLLEIYNQKGRIEILFR